MPKTNNKTQHAKLSPEFMARLLRLKNEQKIRAIILLHTEDARMSPAYARTRGNRQTTIKAIRKSGEQALADIDRILERFDGKRLAAGPDALGSIPVETTAAGITTLVGSEHVKAIFEDQAISLTS
jgi:hypothetical protein